MKNYPQYQPLVRESWNQAVAECLAEGCIGPGKYVKKFEEELKDKYNFRHCLTVNSGTTALMLAIQSLTRLGDTIVAPTYSFLAGHNATMLSGRKITLSPVNQYGVLDASGLERTLQNLNGEASCVLFINHNAFNEYDSIKRLRDIAYKYNCTFLEDSSQCINVTYNDDSCGYCGSLGDRGIFSFSVPKLLTTGQGGAIITNNDRYAKHCEQLRDHGGGDWRKTRIHEAIGGNFRLTDMQAVYGLAQLRDIDELYEKREQIHRWYKKYLGDNYTSEPHSWMCVVNCKWAEGVERRLAEVGIITKQYYYPVSRNIPYGDLDEDSVAAQLYYKWLYLPSSLDLTEEDIKFISEKLLEI